MSIGYDESPRGIKTKELLANTFCIEMTDCVLTIRERALNYKFMAAEAYWILTGDNSVSGIAPFNPNIARFSDDGETFFGAYGPKIMGQIDYVVKTLREDPTSRRATLNIWRENPPDTKDYPCTNTMNFQIRNGALYMHVFMRSSDAWLGLPYDAFNFSMVSHYICAELNSMDPELNLVPGRLFLTMASSHIYEEHYLKANSIAYGFNYSSEFYAPRSATPEIFYKDKTVLLATLEALRFSSKDDTDLRWWNNGKKD
jgi:thymidylate synthase